MNTRQPKYKIYPTLMDAFTKYMDMRAEDYFYYDEDGSCHKNYNESTGEMKFSDAEVDEMAMADLLNVINRVKRSSTALTKGTVFNELVDSFINQKRSELLEMKGNRVDDTINVTYKENEQSFCFSFSFIEEVAEYFKGSINQVPVEAFIETKYGLVQLYGYVDELCKDKVYDIKTTSKGYHFGQYNKYWQRHVYPYCLIESGMCTDISSFEFTCYNLSGGNSKQPVITGKKFPEVYNYSHELSRKLIREHLERLIEFLEANRDKITDKKVFGGFKDDEIN